MDQDDSNLKVTDRRHFTSEGDLRSEASVSPSAAHAEGPGRVEAASHEGAAAPPVSFASFIISLATQAADLIGGEDKDLGAARQIISVLEMLKEKSEGRRTEDETKVIEAVLFDLRLAFVGSAREARS